MLNLLVIIWREQTVSAMQPQIDFLIFNQHFGFCDSEPRYCEGEKHCQKGAKTFRTYQLKLATDLKTT